MVKRSDYPEVKLFSRTLIQVNAGLDLPNGASIYIVAPKDWKAGRVCEVLSNVAKLIQKETDND